MTSAVHLCDSPSISLGKRISRCGVVCSIRIPPIGTSDRAWVTCKACLGDEKQASFMFAPKVSER